MVAQAGVIAIDTNLLVYAHRTRMREHYASRRALQKASEDPRGWGMALPCVAEFWSVVTHPACAGGPARPEEAGEFLRVLIREAGARVWLPQTGFWERLWRLAAHLEVAGPRVFDLQIALAAFENGATELWTHDRGFAGVPGLAIRDPL
jgi:hypothetical protein